MSNQFVVIFNNGGGITLQTAHYCHTYDNPSQVAHDVQALLRNEHTTRWEGNEPEGRQVYDRDIDRNGGYKWHNRADVKEAIQTGFVNWLGWRNIQAFYEALGIRTEKSLYELAREHVEKSKQLSPQAGFILADWPEADEHWSWVLNASEEEILDWVAAGQ